MTKTKIYIIPGLGESTRMINYREIIKSFKKEGFEIVPINITWSTDMSMGDYINQANKQIPNLSDNDYIMGFSFGAYIALILSKKKKVKGFIFCSLSPYFKENLKYIPKESVEYFGKKMIDSFKRYSFPAVSKSKAWFIVGEKDWPLVIKRAEESFNKWKGEKELIIVKKAEHELKHSNYIKEMKKIIKKL